MIAVDIPGRPTTYGQPQPWWPLYTQVTEAAPDLRGRLQVLVQAEHSGAPAEHVQAVRAALWAGVR